MTPQERDLIQSVFDRLARLAGKEKDREAEALILERLRAVPDAAYNLVEAVVVQEMAIKENEARIRELETRLAQAQPAQQPQQAGGFGRPGGVWGRGSVPSTTQPQQYAPQPQPQPQPQQQYAQPSPWGGQPSAGGGFLRTAAGAAVGVAGGMLLANSISSMFAGGHGGAANAQPISETINNYYGTTPQAGGEPQVSYDTGVADDQGYSGGDSGFDPGFDVGGDDSF
jgi:hypothetical protein